MKKIENEFTNFIGYCLVIIAFCLAMMIVGAIMDHSGNKIKPVAKIENTIFSTERPRNILMTAKTIGCGGGHLTSLLIQVYGDTNIYQSSSECHPQPGYAISMPGMIKISSKSLESIEYILSSRKISAIYATIADTSSSEWKNAKPITF